MGVGFGSGGEVGVGVGSTAGTSQTALAAQLDPGPKPGWFAPVLALISGFFLVGCICRAADLHVPLGIPYLLLLTPFVLVRRRRARHLWTQRVAAFQRM